MIVITYTVNTVKAKTNKKQPVSLQKRVRRHVKLAVVPHKDNQFRPHLIRRYGLAAVFVAVVVSQLGYNVSTTGSVLGDQASISTAALLEGTNDARQTQGLHGLRLNQKLNQAAYLKGKDMFTEQYWAHVSPTGTKPWKWFADAGYNYSEAGENLAKNFRTAEATTTAWLNSPEHRANILDPHYKDVGFAVVSGTLHDQPTTIVVALYGQPASTGVVGVQTAVAVSSGGSSSLLTRLGVAAQSMTPALLGSLLLLAFAMAVAFVAHLYRNKLPKALRQSWYRHHGLMKFGGMMSLMIIMLFLYGGGQI